MKQILGCVSYCHEKNIVHRDLKPENILLETNKGYDQIKIIDFGAAIKIGTNELVQEKVGTPYYIAPEALRGKSCQKSDVWSCGVIAYILLSGIPPFNGETELDII